MNDLVAKIIPVFHVNGYKVNNKQDKLKIEIRHDKSSSSVNQQRNQA